MNMKGAAPATIKHFDGQREFPGERIIKFSFMARNEIEEVVLAIHMIVSHILKQFRSYKPVCSLLAQKSQNI
jgi:hypothetical protein